MDEHVEFSKDLADESQQPEELPKRRLWGDTEKQNLAPYLWGPVAWFLVVFCSYSVKNLEMLCDFFTQLKYVLPCQQCRDNYQIKLEKYNINHNSADHRSLQRFALAAYNELREMSNKDPVDDKTLINMVFGTVAYLKRMSTFNSNLFVLEIIVFYLSCILFTFRGQEFIEQYFNHIVIILTALSKLKPQRVATEMAKQFYERRAEFMRLKSAEEMQTFVQGVVDQQKLALQRWGTIDQNTAESFTLQVHPRVLKRVKDFLDEQPLVTELPKKTVDKARITRYELKNWYKYIQLPKLDINSSQMPMYLLVVMKQMKNYRELYIPNEDALQSDMNTFTLFALIAFMFVVFVIVILVVSLVQRLNKGKKRQNQFFIEG